MGENGGLGTIDTHPMGSTITRVYLVWRIEKYEKRKWGGVVK